MMVIHDGWGYDPRTAEFFCPGWEPAAPAFLHRSCEVGHFIGMDTAGDAVRSARRGVKIGEK
jgi:hypothetical protein